MLEISQGILENKTCVQNFNAFRGIFISLEHVFLHLNWRGHLFHPKMSNHVGTGKVLTKVVVFRQRQGQQEMHRFR